MTIKVLIDHNVEGQAKRLWKLLVKSGWDQVAGIVFVYFDEAGLPENTPDRAIWQFMQEHQMFLLTGNRNNDGKDSLAQTIRDENTATFLPAITFGNADRVKEKNYCARCLNDLLEIVLYSDKYLGTGRQYIPQTKGSS